MVALPGYRGLSLRRWYARAMRTHTVAHEGRQTAYRLRDGEGEERATIFVHGAGASHAVWRAQFRLASERPVAAVDLSGHGESADIDAEPGWETISAYASDVLAVIEDVEARFVVGHSLGGAVAIHLAANRTADLDGIGVIGTGPRLPVHRDILHLAATDFEGLVSFLHEPDRLFHDVDETTLDVSREAMHACGQGVTNRDFRTANALDLRGELDRLSIPVLAVCGEHDRLTPVRVHERLVSAVATATLEVIPGAAHVAMLERPDAVNDVLSRFLGGIESDS